MIENPAIVDQNSGHVSVSMYKLSASMYNCLATMNTSLEGKLDSGLIKTSPRDGLRAIGKETTPNCATLGHSDLI